MPNDHDDDDADFDADADFDLYEILGDSNAGAYQRVEERIGVSRCAAESGGSRALRSAMMSL